MVKSNKISKLTRWGLLVGITYSIPAGLVDREVVVDKYKEELRLALQKGTDADYIYALVDQLQWVFPAEALIEIEEAFTRRWVGW